MSTSQTEMNPNWAQPEKQRSGCGMSCLMIGCGGTLLLCCGVGTWGFFYVSSLVTEDPAEIAAQRDRIAKIDVPASLEPAMAISLKLPFVDEFGFGVVYVDTEGGSSLILMSLNRSFAEDEEGLQDVLQQALRQQDLEQEEDFQVSESHERQFTVRGQEVTFFFDKGKSTKTGEELILVKGTFEGDSGPVIFLFFGDPEAYDEEAVAEIIESIQ